MDEFINSLVSGVAGGLIVLVIQKLNEEKEKKKEEQRSLIISPEKFVRTLPSNILDFIEPGISVEKSREILGIANNSGTSFFGDIEDAIEATYFLYRFSNATILLTSTNKESISSVTIYGNSPKFPIEYSSMFANGVLSEMTLDDEVMTCVTKYGFERFSRELYFYVQAYGARTSNYHHHTYFGEDMDGLTDDKVNERKTNQDEDFDPKPYLNRKIDGVCISNLSDLSPYISMYER